MKIRTTAGLFLIVGGLACSVPALAQTQPAVTVKSGAASAPGAAVAARTVKTTATVVAIDAATRKVTLKGQDGKVFDLTASDQVKRFAEIKVGDRITAEYLQALTLELKKGGAGAAGMSEQAATARAPATERPGGAVARQVTIVADVVAVDTQKKTVTLRGPKGNTVDLNVQDPGQLKNIKKGDQVEAVYTEALAVGIEATPAK